MPVLQLPDHDLDTVSACVAVFVVLDGLARRLPARNAWLYLPVSQLDWEPVRVVA